MKGHDLPILIHLLEASPGADLTYQAIGGELGIATSQVFEAIERCEDLGLLARDHRAVQVDRLLELAQHALPYLFPLRIGAPTRGLPLVLQSIGGATPGQPARLVWEETTDSADAIAGVCIKPLDKRMPTLARANPRRHRIYSYLEVLRLLEHPLRTFAAEQLALELRAPAAAEVADGAPVLDGKRLEAVMELAVQHVSRWGFRATRISDLATVTKVSEAALRMHFESDARLHKAVVEYLAKVAGQFTGPLAILTEQPSARAFVQVVASFFDFLETNETYYRVAYWCYLERDLPVARDLGVPFNTFVTLMGQLMSKVSGKATPREQLFLGYMMSALPEWYFFSYWAESVHFAPELIPGLRQDLRRFMLEELLPRAFEF